MKRISLFILMAVALVSVSCIDSELDPLEGIYPSAKEVKLTSLQRSETHKDDKGRGVFDLELTDGSTPIRFTFIGSKYYLPAGVYTQAPDASAKDGNFVLETTSVAGKAVKQGSITVNKNDDNYSLYGVLFLEDGTIVKPSWKGELQYVKPELPPLGYTFTVADPADVTDASSAVVAGVKSNVVTLNDLDGNFAAQFNLILKEGVTDLVGRYSVKEYASDPYSAGNGFDLGIYFGMNPGDYVIGSYYKKDGEVVIIEPGDLIEVYMEEGLYVFEGNSGFQFVAKPYEKPDQPDEPEVVYSLDSFLTYADYYTMYNVPLVGVEVSTSGIEYTPADYAAGVWFPTYAGSGNFLKAEFYSADGTIAPGTYVPCADANAMQPGEFKIGSANGGSTWNTVVDGKVESEFITDGTITVSVKGKTYTIEVASSTVKAKFVGKLSNEPETFGLTDFLSFQSYAMYGINLAGVELATPGFSYETVIDWTTWTATTTYSGDGSYLKLELYTEGDTLAPGVYTPSVDPENVAVGEFKTGYDNNGSPYGTTWYSVVDNVATYKYITDGTVTVSVDNGYYVIELVSSAVVAKYVGKLSK